MKAFNKNHLKHVFVQKLLAADASLHSWKFQGQKKKIKSVFKLREQYPVSFD